MASLLLNENWLTSLPNEVAENYNKLSQEVVAIICNRIKEVGNLLPSDITAMTNAVQWAGTDIDKIEKAIQRRLKLSRAQVEKIFTEAAKQNDQFARTFYEYRGLMPQTIGNSVYLQSLVTAIERQTNGAMTNLSNTFAFKMGSGRPLTIRQTYTQVIDKAIYQVKSGVFDYQTAMRSTVKRLADSGLRTVYVNGVLVESPVVWASGYTRRVDSSVRQNILDGVRQLSAQMMAYNGEQFGADGVELSAHAISAPDHAPAQGRQYTNEEFAKMQNGEDFADVNGNDYEGFDRPIGEWNCKHIAIPIVVGASEPVYSEEQLEKMKQNSRKRYDRTQEQRKMETKIRRMKDEQAAYKEAGMDDDARNMRKEVAKAIEIYRRYSLANGLTPKYERV